MKTLKYILPLCIAAVFTACSTMSSGVSKGKAYKGIYDSKPVSVLIMPPINKTTNVEAKEVFHSTMFIPVANAGYYVIPPFLSMEIMKRESAWDAEMFVDAPLNKFGEIFGADLAVFTVITKWNKTALAQVVVEVEYIVKSTKTNQVVYRRKGTINYDASVGSSGGGMLGMVANLAASAINTAVTKYVDIAKICNAYTLQDLPAGKYSAKCGNDGEESAGKAEFNVNLNSNYKAY